MIKRYVFKPKVPGQMGDNTLVDHRFDPIRIYHLHFVFDYYPDDFFTSTPIFVMSESLLFKIIDSGFSGIDNPRLISYEMNEQFNDLYPNDSVPTQRYYMVDINGQIDDDFNICYINGLKRVNVTERALNLLNSQHKFTAEVNEYNL